MEEVAKGWSEGPFSFDELPEGAVVSKRFAIQQGQKVRPIDDLSQSFLNAAFGSEGSYADNNDRAEEHAAVLSEPLHRSESVPCQTSLSLARTLSKVEPLSV